MLIQMWDNQYDDDGLPQLVSEWGSNPNESDEPDSYMVAQTDNYNMGEAIKYLHEYITGSPDIDPTKITLQFRFNDEFTLALQPINHCY